MPRERQEPITPFILSLMDRFEAEDINHLSEKTGVPKSTLFQWAAVGRSNRQMESLAKNAKALKLSADEVIHGVLTGEPPEDSDV